MTTPHAHAFGAGGESTHAAILAGAPDTPDVLGTLQDHHQKLQDHQQRISALEAHPDVDSPDDQESPSEDVK